MSKNRSDDNARYVIKREKMSVRFFVKEKNLEWALICYYTEIIFNVHKTLIVSKVTFDLIKALVTLAN